LIVIAVNGSPRKNWNTHTLLTKALEGAESEGAKTEMVNLYDLDYKGCNGCLECKKKYGNSAAKCVTMDGLKPVLEKIESCGALILGSPIYIGDVTGMMRSFMERLLFQYSSYEEDRIPCFSRRIQTAFFYTMNARETAFQKLGYANIFKNNASVLEIILGPSRVLVSTETYQIENYSKYKMSRFNEEERLRRRKEIFPLDCQKAYEIGAEMAANR